MKRRIILYVSVTLAVCFCFAVMSCKGKSNSPYEQFMEKLTVCQDNLECSLDMDEVARISQEIKVLSVEVKKVEMNKEEQQILVNKIVSMATLGIIKSQIINQTNSLKVNPTREEMQEFLSDVSIKKLIQN